MPPDHLRGGGALTPSLRFDPDDIKRLTAALEFRFRYLSERKLTVLFVMSKGHLYPTMGWCDFDCEPESGTDFKLPVLISHDFNPKKLSFLIGRLGLENRHREALQRYLLDDRDIRKMIRDRKRTFWKAWERTLSRGHSPLWFERVLASPKWNERLAAKGATWKDVRIYEAAAVEITHRLQVKIQRVHLSEDAVRKQLQRARKIRSSVLA